MPHASSARPPRRRNHLAAAALACLAAALPASAAALPAAGQTGLPMPRAGYSGDVFGQTLDLRNDHNLVVKPSRVRIGNEEWALYRGITWNRWGKPSAQGTGAFYRCTEGGCARLGRGTIKLAARKAYGCENRRRTVRVYTRIGFVEPGTSVRWYTILPSIYC